MKLQGQAFERLQSTNVNAATDQVFLKGDAGRVISTGLATGQGSQYILQVRSPEIDPMGNGKCMVFCTIKKGTATLGLLMPLTTVINGVGLATITFQNIDGVNPVNGTHEIDVLIFN